VVEAAVGGPGFINVTACRAPSGDVPLASHPLLADAVAGDAAPAASATASAPAGTHTHEGADESASRDLGAGGVSEGGAGAGAADARVADDDVAPLPPPLVFERGPHVLTVELHEPRFTPESFELYYRFNVRLRACPAAVCVCAIVITLPRDVVIVARLRSTGPIPRTTPRRATRGISSRRR
jgi:hypothetical protein